MTGSELDHPNLHSDTTYQWNSNKYLGMGTCHAFLQRFVHSWNFESDKLYFEAPSFDINLSGATVRHIHKCNRDF